MRNKQAALYNEVLQPVYNHAKAAYDRSHSHRAARNLRDAATYLLLAEIKMSVKYPK